jgi:hypothetical protein
MISNTKLKNVSNKNIIKVNTKNKNDKKTKNDKSKEKNKKEKNIFDLSSSDSFEEEMKNNPKPVIKSNDYRQEVVQKERGLFGSKKFNPKLYGFYYRVLTQNKK